MNKDDKYFLKNKLTEKISVPESLSPESIEKLVNNEKQIKVKSKGSVKRFISVAVAACVVLTSLVILSDKGFLFPEINNEEADEQTTVCTPEDNYDDIIKIIRDYGEKYKINNKNYTYYYTADDTLVQEDGKAEAAVGTPTFNAAQFSGSGANSSHGEINLRDKDVKEADIFITDGEYLYCVSNFQRCIKIIKANTDGTMETVYERELTEQASDGNGDSIYYRELYKYENYLLVGFLKFTMENHETKKGISGFQIFDISDKSAPRLVREVALDGSFISSRIADNKLIFINSYSITKFFYGKDDTVLIPSSYNNSEAVHLPCDCIHIEKVDAADCYVNIGILDLSDMEKELETASFLGSGMDTYCTKDTLYIMGSEYANYYNGAFIGAIMLRGNKTTLTSVDISGEKIKVNASTTLDGNIINSYAIDDFEGYIRVALQKEEDNSILVLNKKLEKVSELTGIAKGEQIKSARFMGNTAYVVTFVQTDPLFIIDLTNPEKPEITGEVKLPGFSSYLHPVGDGLLVGIGQGGTEDGLDGSSKISLFDVTDRTSPKEIDSVSFPNSSLTTEPKAYCAVSENSFLIPYSSHDYTDSAYIDNGKFIDARYPTGALYIAVENGRLVLKNAFLAHGTGYTERATFINDNVYIFNCTYGSLAAFNINTAELIDTVAGTHNAEFTKIISSKEDILF